MLAVHRCQAPALPKQRVRHANSPPAVLESSPDRAEIPLNQSTNFARLACGVAIVAALVSSTAPSPLYPIYIEQMGLSQSMGTAIFAVYALGTLAMLLLQTIFSAYLPSQKRILLIGLAVSAVGSIVFATAPSAQFLLIGRSMNGIATGLITNTATSALYQLDANGSRRAATISTLGFTGGAASGPLLATAFLVSDFAPTVMPFVVIMVVAILGFIGILLTRRLGPAAPKDPEHGSEPAPCATEGRASYALFALACLGVAAAWMTASVFMAVGIAVSHEIFGITSAFLSGLLPALFQVCAGIAQTAGGRLSGMRALRWGFAGIALTQVLMIVPYGSFGMSALLVILTIWGIAYGLAFVGATGIAAVSAPVERRGRFLTRFFIIAYLSNAIPVFSLGVMIDLTGLYTAFRIFAIFSALLAGAGFLMSRRLRHADIQQEGIGARDGDDRA